MQPAHMQRLSHVGSMDVWAEECKQGATYEFTFHLQDALLLADLFQMTTLSNLFMKLKSWLRTNQ